MLRAGAPGHFPHKDKILNTSALKPSTLNLEPPYYYDDDDDDDDYYYYSPFRNPSPPPVSGSSGSELGMPGGSGSKKPSSFSACNAGSLRTPRLWSLGLRV